MRRFYAPPDNFDGQIAALGLEESSHLREVLRLREGAEVSVFDGAGNEFRCRVEKIGDKKTPSVLRILEKASDGAAESSLNLSLAAAILKGEKFDLVVQKACELGVSRIVPLLTKRADVKIKDAKEAEKKLARWRKIAVEAAKQSGRTRLMPIDAPQAFEKFAKAAQGTKLLFAERGGESLHNFLKNNSNLQTIIAVTGAEGGWEDSEIEAARARGFQIVTLGGRILRAETAAIAVAALLQNRFGDLG